MAKKFVLKIPSNTKYLIIHESPTEVKTAYKYIKEIEKELWWKTILLATTWHFYTTSKNSLDINIKKRIPNFKIDSKKRDIVKNLKEAYKIVKKNKGKIIIWTDPDREWEVIAFSVVKVLWLKKGEYERMRLRSLDKEWYLKALKNREKDLDWNMVDSWIARQILDKIIWFEKTKILWKLSNNYFDTIDKTIKDYVNNFSKKYENLIKENDNLEKTIQYYKNLDFKKLKKLEKDRFNKKIKLPAISIWRVQTPTLRLLVEKDLEKFQKELKRKLNLFLIDKDNNKREYIKNKEYEDKPERIKIVYEVVKNFIQKNKIEYLEIKDIQTKKQKINPPEPLNTQRAQTLINSIFWFSIKKIMDILQENYENWRSTYMRTDSIDIPEEYKEKIKKMLEKNKIKSKFIDRDYKSEDAQEGHHAILPTQIYDLNNLPWSWDNKKILEFVVRTSIASLLEPAEIEYITYIIWLKLEYKWKSQEVKFILKDTKIIKKWFLEVYIYSLDKYKTKYNFKKWDKIFIKDLFLKQKDIKLPWIYSEWSLVKKLKELGIWRPSTWQTIIQTLKEKQYITSQSNKLQILERWYRVYEIIKNNLDKFWNIFDLNFTAKMETWLDEIETWKKEKWEVIEEILKELNINKNNLIT
jgi:DNA topoisomerase IA